MAHRYPRATWPVRSSARCARPCEGIGPSDQPRGPGLVALLDARIISRRTAIQHVAAPLDITDIGAEQAAIAANPG
jgi:hypothetical protein